MPAAPCEKAGQRGFGHRPPRPVTIRLDATPEEVLAAADGRLQGRAVPARPRYTVSRPSSAPAAPLITSSRASSEITSA